MIAMRAADENPRRLEDLSDVELERLEDRLLVERELDWTMRSGATAGRIVVLVLFVALFFILNGAAGKLLAGVELGIALFVAAYMLLLAGAVVGAWLIWKSVGRHGRRILRLGLHYWPVTLYVIALLAGVWPH
jgi:hypothetical protein